MDYTNFLVRNCPKTAMYIPNFITSEEEQRILAQIDKTPKPKWTQLSHRRLINYGGIPHPNGMIAEEIPNWLQLFVDKINNLGIFEMHKANHVLVNEYLSGQGIMPHTDGPMFHPIISTISCGSHTILEFYKNNTKENSEENSYDENLTYDNAITSSTSPTSSSLFSAEGDKNDDTKSHGNISENQEQNSNSTDNNECFEKSTKLGRKVVCKLLVEPRSLLILKDSLYKDYLHAISEKSEDVICDLVCNLENCENSYKFGDKIKRDKRISLTIRHVPKTTKLKLKFLSK